MLIIPCRNQRVWVWVYVCGFAVWSCFFLLLFRIDGTERWSESFQRVYFLSPLWAIVTWFVFFFSPNSVSVACELVLQIRKLWIGSVKKCRKKGTKKYHKIGKESQSRTGTQTKWINKTKRKKIIERTSGSLAGHYERWRQSRNLRTELRLRRFPHITSDRS